MSVIYLVHEIHGAKVAISEDEAISDEMYGWMRYDPNEAVSATTETSNSLATQTSKRRRAVQDG